MRASAAALHLLAVAVQRGTTGGESAFEDRCNSAVDELAHTALEEQF